MTTVPPVPSPRPAEELQALCDAATPGPWFIRPDSANDFYDVQMFDVESTEDVVAQGGVVEDGGPQVGACSREDAEFIAAARTDLPALLADRERLSAELADARATVERYAEFTQRFEGDAEAAERALGAVRAELKPLADALLSMRFSKYRDQAGWAWLNAEGIGAKLAALSAASPTTSDDEPIPMVECNFHGHAHPVGWVGCASSRRAASEAETREAIARQIEQQIPDLTFDDGHTTTATDEARMLVKRQAAAIARGPAAASDEPARCLHGNAAAQTYACGCEPARCDHGHTEAHTVPVHLAGFGCPGPAASGTPETTA